MTKTELFLKLAAPDKNGVKVPIISVGDVSAATARITVNYGYDSYS